MEALEKTRKIADYQFGKGAGRVLIPDDAKISFSRTTGRIRHIHAKGKLLATLRPTDGMLSLTVNGAKRLNQEGNIVDMMVGVSEDAALFVTKGKSVFAKHVTHASVEIRPCEETIVRNKDREVLAVGKAALTGREMTTFKRGVAVRVRRGTGEEKGKQRR
jgi:predicted RNA-binding protein (TIGR00451 family)